MSKILKTFKKLKKFKLFKTFKIFKIFNVKKCLYNYNNNYILKDEKNKRIIHKKSKFWW